MKTTFCDVGFLNEDEYLSYDNDNDNDDDGDDDDAYPDQNELWVVKTEDWVRNKKLENRS